MAFYLIQAAYNEAGAAHLVQHPQHREEALKKTCEALGGRMHQFFFCFGKYDAMLIAELPDNRAAAALALSAEARGAVRMIHTTALLTPDDAIEAMKLAATDQYVPPA